MTSGRPARQPNPVKIPSLIFNRGPCFPATLRNSLPTRRRVSSSSVWLVGSLTFSAWLGASSLGTPVKLCCSGAGGVGAVLARAQAIPADRASAALPTTRRKPAGRGPVGPRRQIARSAPLRSWEHTPSPRPSIGFFRAPAASSMSGFGPLSKGAPPSSPILTTLLNCLAWPGAPDSARTAINSSSAFQAAARGRNSPPSRSSPRRSPGSNPSTAKSAFRPHHAFCHHSSRTRRPRRHRADHYSRFARARGAVEFCGDFPRHFLLAPLHFAASLPHFHAYDASALCHCCCP